MVEKQVEADVRAEYEGTDDSDDEAGLNVDASYDGGGAHDDEEGIPDYDNILSESLSTVVFGTGSSEPWRTRPYPEP